MTLENKIQNPNKIFSVMIAFLLSYFLFNDIGIRYIFGYAVLGVLLLVAVIITKFKIYLSNIKVLYLLMVAVVTVFSILPGSNFNHQVFSLTISMLMFTAFFVFMAPSENDISKALKAIQIMAVIFSLYIFFVKIFPSVYWDYIYPHLGEYSKQFGGRFVPEGYGVPIGGSTTYAGYLIFISLIINMATILKEGFPKDKKKTVFIILSSVLYFSAIMLTNRRSEAISSVVTMGLMFILSLNFKDKKDLIKKLLIMVVAICLMIAIVLSLASLGFLPRYEDLFGFIAPDKPAIDDPEIPELPEMDETVSADELSSGRLALWQKAGELFAKNPVFGIGWEQFMNHNTYEHDVHNSYLQWLCESGVIGFVLIFVPLILIYLITFLQLLRFNRNSEISGFAKNINFISFALQTFLLIVNFIDPAFYHLNYFCFFVLALILAETAGKLETIHTGVEKDCLRNKFLPKLAKLKLFY